MKSIFLFSFLLLFSSSWTAAQSVSSPIVGFNAVDIAPDADTYITVGFHRVPFFAGALSSAVAAVNGSATLNLGSVNLGAVNGLAGTHYVQIRTGNEAGQVLLITANSSNSITVAVEEGELLPLAAGDQISVIPSWTLESFLPAAQQPVAQRSTSDLPPGRQLEILLYEGGSGTGLSPSRIFYLTDGGWKESTAGFPDASDVVLSTQSVLVVRSRAGGAAWKLISSGQVNMLDSIVSIPTSDQGKQDTVLGLDRPVPVNLEDLGLESVIDASASNDQQDRKDELLVFDNSAVTRNRGAARTYFRVGSSWIEDTAGFPNSATVSIPPEAGLVVRKSISATGDPVVWRNQPSWQSLPNP